MTREDREDAIDIIQSILDRYEEDECLVCEITIGDEDIKALKMAIEVLKQEPILEKIRAEMEQEYTKFRNKSDMWNERACGLGTALEIIDKYRAESEGRNESI